MNKRAIPQGYKETKIGVVPLEWEVVKLGDYIHIKHGWAFKGEFFSEHGNYILLSPRNFFEEGGFRLRKGKEKFYIGEFPKKYLLKKNDIIIAMTEQGIGLLGSSALIPENNKFLHNQRLGLLEIQNKNLVFFKYLYYLFFQKGIRNKIISESTGTKVKHTSPKTISNIQISLPPLKEQQKIAKILTTWDRAIEKQEALIVAKEEFKKGLMQRLLSGDWDEVRLKEILKGHKLGGNYKNSLEITENPLIKMGNINRGQINISKIEYILNSEDIDTTHLIKYGDLFFNTRNTLDLVGKVAIWRNELDKAFYNSNLMKLEFNDKVKSNFFMNYLFNSKSILNKLRSYAIGTTSVSAIYTRDLLNIKIPLPPLKEQQKIAQILTTADKEIELLKHELEVLREQKRGLMQRLLMGEVRCV